MSTNNIDELRKSEGVYTLGKMQKMATIAATADGLRIEGKNFKVGALTGCPDMVLFACETIIEQANRIAELEQDLGLTKIAFEQKRDLLKSCESALESRDAKIEELEADNALLRQLKLVFNGSAYGSPDLTYGCVEQMTNKRDLEMKRQGFWLGFEDARCHPDEMNILAQWQNTKTFKQSDES